MPPPRPKGIGFTTGVTPARPSSNAPMSERQQMALLIQMTATSSTDTSRTSTKKTENKKGENPEIDENLLTEKQQQESLDAKEKPSAAGATDDCILDSSSSRTAVDANAGAAGQSGTNSSAASKRCYSDIEDEFDELGEDSKKKKKKDTENTKEFKSTSLKLSSKIEKNSKLSSSAKASPSGSKLYAIDKEQQQQQQQIEISSNNNNNNNNNNNSSNNSSNKNAVTTSTASADIENETEGSDDYKSNDSLYNGGLKVPPLKIVIPQPNCSIDTEGNVLRTGKVAATRNAALPYVVSSNSDSIDTIISNQCISPHENSPQKVNAVCPAAGAAATAAASASQQSVLDDKNIKLFNDEKNLRVLRSSHRSGVASAERSSNNSSPQMQSSSPSPASSNHANDNNEAKASSSSSSAASAYNNMSASPIQQGHQFDNDGIANVPSPSTSSTSSSKDINSTSSNVDLHPRKRKIRPKNANEDNGKNANPNLDASVAGGESHPHDYPFTNGFQMFLNIRRQIEKKWKTLYPVKPRPPQGYNDYLLTKRSYLLNKNANTTPIEIPNTVPEALKKVYRLQEKARRELIEAHTVEREKLCLNVEQEIIRVHSKAARSISGQSEPYSVCTYLKDDEVYNMMTPEQDEKEKSARCRFNGRLLLSWLQDVDDKWEKIKELMVLRHHNEAESLHAVQVMDWNISAKRSKLSDSIYEEDITKDHVPIVYVGDDFDTLPT